jgi:hypothetical protein
VLPATPTGQQGRQIVGVRLPSGRARRVCDLGERGCLRPLLSIVAESRVGASKTLAFVASDASPSIGAMELRPLGWANPRPDRIESRPSVDITQLRRIELVTPVPAQTEDEDQSVGWIQCRGERATVVFDRKRSLVEIVYAGTRGSFGVTWSACRFGGRRAWAVCPLCASRRVRLYFVAGRWACRDCQGLRYETQRLRPADRALLKAQRARQRLGQVHPVPLGAPPPPPPRRMRARTYLALTQRIHDAELAALGRIHDSSGSLVASAPGTARDRHARLRD